MINCGKALASRNSFWVTRLIFGEYRIYIYDRDIPSIPYVRSITYLHRQIVYTLFISLGLVVARAESFNELGMHHPPLHPLRLHARSWPSPCKALFR